MKYHTGSVYSKPCILCLAVPLQILLQCAALFLFYSMPEVVYKYFMTVSPVDGRLYISDHKSLRIIRVKTMGPARDLSQNFEVIAGTGEQCVPGDRERCGDGGPATSARLFYPKGRSNWLVFLTLLILTWWLSST